MGPINYQIPHLDFPTAWVIQLEHVHGTALDHDARCSSVPGWSALSGPGLLCDCGAVEDEWKRRRALLGFVRVPRGY